ncbi:MAG: hypothetical protein ACHQ50_04470 [Fimbriimonadales bacterium]
MELRAKPDAEAALERMERWWLCENTDRPLLTVAVERPPSQIPPKNYETHEARWLDFERRIDVAIEETSTGTYLAETFPTFEPNLGPDILSTLYGLDLEFAEDTSWGSPFLASLEEVIEAEPSFDAPLWRAVERLQQMGLETGSGRWITLFTDLHGNADIPSALIGPQALCLQFAEDLDLVSRAIEHVTEGCVEAYRRQIRPLIDAGLPIGTWLRCFSKGRSYVPQADFSAMVGPEMFETAILPSVLRELEETDRAIYHLDGPSALHHLDAILEVPAIHAVQWVYGDGNGPARRWVEVYRKILAKGKGIRVEAETPDDILELHKTLGNEGVWYGANFGPLPLADASALLLAIS